VAQAVDSLIVYTLRGLQREHRRRWPHSRPPTRDFLSQEVASGRLPAERTGARWYGVSWAAYCEWLERRAKSVVPVSRAHERVACRVDEQLRRERSLDSINPGT